MELHELDSSGSFGPRRLIKSLWDFSSSDKKLLNGDPVSELCHAAYSDYYERQWSLTVAHCDGKFVALKTPEAVNQLVFELQGGRSRAELLNLIKGTGDESVLTEACENSLNLAFRLLLMLRIGAVKYQFHTRRCLDWNEGSPRDFVKRHFGEQPVLDFNSVKLPKAFHGWSLEKVGGIKISFESNLADHLLATVTGLTYGEGRDTVDFTHRRNVISAFENAINKGEALHVTNETFDSTDPAPGRAKIAVLKYFTERGGKEKCRLIKEGDHVHFGYDIRKITYGKRENPTDYTGKKKAYAAFMNALEHMESITINNGLFGKDPNPNIAKFFTIEYKVAYDHFNTELGSDAGTYKRHAVYEGGKIDFMWEILRIEYCSTEKNDFWWGRHVNQATKIDDPEVYRKFYEQWLPKKSLYICNELMGPDPYPGKEKRARMLARYPEDRGYTYCWMIGDEGGNMSWTTPEQFSRDNTNFVDFLDLFERA
ncbi:hypothetical protein ACLX1H_009002 [Fusarium chlamydosporum]